MTKLGCLSLTQTWMSALRRTVGAHRDALIALETTHVHASAATEMCMTTGHYAQVTT